MTDLKKLEAISLKMAHAVVDVQRWSETLSKALDKKPQHKLADLHDEAQKIEYFAKMLKHALMYRDLSVREVGTTALGNHDELVRQYHEIRNNAEIMEGAI